MVAKKYFNIERFYICLFIILIYLFMVCAPETTRNSDEDKIPI